MNEKEYKIVTTILNFALLIMSLASLYILTKFTALHIVYFPEEIPYIKQEAYILISSAVFFIVSMKFKFKLSMVIAFIAILLGLFNFGAFTTMTILYYRELNLDAFIIGRLIGGADCSLPYFKNDYNMKCNMNFSFSNSIHCSGGRIVLISHLFSFLYKKSVPYLKVY